MDEERRGFGSFMCMTEGAEVDKELSFSFGMCSDIFALIFFKHSITKLYTTKLYTFMPV